MSINSIKQTCIQENPFADELYNDTHLLFHVTASEININITKSLEMNFQFGHGCRESGFVHILSASALHLLQTCKIGNYSQT